MPNYRYNTPDYMRRNNYGRSNNTSNQSSSCPSSACVSESHSPNTCASESVQHRCDARTEYDQLKGMPIAMAYVPWQQWRDLYEAEKGFQRGTIFEELDKPFKGIGGCCR